MRGPILMGPLRAGGLGAMPFDPALFAVFDVFVDDKGQPLQ